MQAPNLECPPARVQAAVSGTYPCTGCEPCCAAWPFKHCAAGSAFGQSSLITACNRHSQLPRFCRTHREWQGVNDWHGSDIALLLSTPAVRVQVMFSQQTAMIVDIARKYGTDIAKLAVQKVSQHRTALRTQLAHAWLAAAHCFTQRCSSLFDLHRQRMQAT